MDLYAYLTQHDGKPRPDGPELIRIAAATGISSYYVYLTALGHKRVSEDTANRMSQSSIGGALSVTGVNRRPKRGNTESPERVTTS